MTTWTPELDAEFIRLRTARTPVETMAVRFGTTAGAIYAHARLLKAFVMTRKEWTAEEVAQLKRLDDSETSIREIARILDRTDQSVSWKLDDLGRSAKRMRYWTEDEPMLVRMHEAGKSVEEIAQRLNRSITAVRDRLAQIGFSEKRQRWTDEEIETLRDAVALGDDAAAIAARLDREPGPVAAKAYSLGLRFRRPRVLTDDEIAELRVALARKGGVAAFAKAKNLDVRFVRRAAHEAGLGVQTRRRRPLDDDGKAEIVAAARSGMTVTAAVAALGRDHHTLKRIAAEAGLEFARAVRRVDEREAEIRAQARAAREAERRRERDEAMAARRRAKEAARREREAALAAEAAVRREERRPTSAARAAPPVLSKTRASAPIRPIAAPIARAIPVVVANLPARTGPSRPARAFMPFVRRKAPGPAMTQEERDEAIARFLATREVTRETVDPVEEAVRAIRRRGYTVVREDASFVIDGRIRIDGPEGLADFASARGIEAPQALAATG